MSRVNWREILGWTDEQLEELRLSGFSFLREGIYHKARLFFEALVILDPKCAYDRQTLGALYLQVNEPQKALATLDIALQLEPTHEPTLLNKTKALISLHKHAEAEQIAKQLAKSEDPSIADDALALIAAYK